MAWGCGSCCSSPAAGTTAPGCFQPQTWDFSYGQPFTQDTVDELLRLLQPDYIAGLTLLGGEPMEPENQPAPAGSGPAGQAGLPGKKTSGASPAISTTIFAAGKIGDGAVTRALLGLVDVLVDGEFILARKKAAAALPRL